MKQKKLAQKLSPLSDPDQFLDQAVERARENAERLRKDAISFVKREPEKALLSALAAGYVLRTLPVVPILGLVARVAVGVFKPVAFSYLVARAFRSRQTSVDENEGG